MRKKVWLLQWERIAVILLVAMTFTLGFNVHTAQAYNTPFAGCEFSWNNDGLPLDLVTAPVDAAISLVRGNTATKSVTLVNCTHGDIINKCYLVSGPGDELMNFSNLPADTADVSNPNSLAHELVNDKLSFSCLYKTEDGPFTGLPSPDGSISQVANCDAGTSEFFAIQTAADGTSHCFANAGSIHTFVGNVNKVCTGNNTGSLMMDTGNGYQEIFFPQRNTCYTPTNYDFFGSTNGGYPAGHNSVRVMIN